MGFRGAPSLNAKGRVRLTFSKRKPCRWGNRQGLRREFDGRQAGRLWCSIPIAMSLLFDNHNPIRAVAIPAAMPATVTVLAKLSTSATKFTSLSEVASITVKVSVATADANAKLFCAGNRRGRHRDGRDSS